MPTERRKTLPLREAYVFLSEKGFSDDVAEIRDMEIEWDRSYTSTLRRGYIVRVLQQHDLLNEFIRIYWTDGAGHRRDHFGWPPAAWDQCTQADQ